MPILGTNTEDDTRWIDFIARKIARDWNLYGMPHYGFGVYLHPESTRKVSLQGGSILEEYFPSPPGPFKRLAALLVVSRLVPLFHIGHFNSLGKFVPAKLEFTKEWLPRICCYLISPVLQRLYIEQKQGSRLYLTDWNDFPSLHSKEEFLLWMQMMENYENRAGFSSEYPVILARRILSAALIIEAVYFQGPNKSKLCGICDGALDITNVVYDKIVATNWNLDTKHQRPNS